MIDVPKEPEEATLLRRAFLKCDIQPSALRRVFEEYTTPHSFRVLWLEKGIYLVVCSKQIAIFDSKIEDITLIDFVNECDSELQKIARVASVMMDTGSSISLPLNLWVTVLDANGTHTEVLPEQRAQSIGPNVSLQFHWSSVEILSNRPEGVRIFFDAIATDSHARKISEFFRLLEAGFGVKGSRLAKPLTAFLASGKFPINSDEWKSLKRMRDQLSHAYNLGKIAYEPEAEAKVSLMQGIAADVLVNKRHWGAKDSARLERDRVATFKAPDGTIHITQGYTPTMTMGVRDAITGTNLHLSAQDLNKAHRRYTDRFLKVLKAK